MFAAVIGTMAVSFLFMVFGMYRFAKADDPEQEFWSVFMIFVPMIVILTAWLYGYKMVGAV